MTPAAFVLTLFLGALTYVEASLFPGLGMWHPHCNLLSGEDVEMDY